MYINKMPISEEEGDTIDALGVIFPAESSNATTSMLIPLDCLGGEGKITIPDQPE